MRAARTHGIVLALGLLVAAQAAAQQPDLSELAMKRDKKLASPFLRCAKWNTGYDQARSAAKASGKLILGYFTRSYAPCGPCMQLEETVLARPEFVEFSKDVVLFLHVSTHIPTDPDAFLFAEKGGNAFPTLMVLDADGNVLARQCGERSMRAVRALMDDARGFADLRQRAESGDVAVRYECLCKQLEYGHLEPEVARERVTALGDLPADRRAWLDAAITSRECCLAFQDIRKAVDDAGRMQGAKRLVEMKKSGHIPTGPNLIAFWEWVLTYAAHTQDVKLYEDGLVATKTLLGSDPANRESLQEKESTLERMKRETGLVGASLMPKN